MSITKRLVEYIKELDFIKNANAEVCLELESKVLKQENKAIIVLITPSNLSSNKPLDILVSYEFLIQVLDYEYYGGEKLALELSEVFEKRISDQLPNPEEDNDKINRYYFFLKENVSYSENNKQGMYAFSFNIELKKET